MIRRLLSIVLAIAFVSAAGLTAATAAETRPLVLHVKTSLSVDDAQTCVVPNIAWAALSEGRAVTVVFDGSAVTSITNGLGWRGWVGISSTAMNRGGLPEPSGSASGGERGGQDVETSVGAGAGKKK